MSDLTFAFLEDTNQYVLNYTLAGRLVVPESDVLEKLGSFLFITGSVVVDDVIPPTPAPGQLRWGRNQGCGYVCQGRLESRAFPCKTVRPSTSVVLHLTATPSVPCVADLCWTASRSGASGTSATWLARTAAHPTIECRLIAASSLACRPQKRRGRAASGTTAHNAGMCVCVCALVCEGSGSKRTRRRTHMRDDTVVHCWTDLLGLSPQQRRQRRLRWLHVWPTLRLSILFK